MRMPAISLLFFSRRSSFETVGPITGTREYPLLAPRTVRIQVVTYLPTTFVYGMGCETALGISRLSNTVHNEQLNSSPKDCLQQAFALIEWTKQLRRRFGKSVQVHLVDAISLQGFWLSLRYRVRRYPAIIVDGKMHPIGPSELLKLDSVIAGAIALGRQHYDTQERR